MKYIVIDDFNGLINVPSKTEGAEDVIFDSAKEAQKFCDENAQNGQVVPLGMDVMKTILDLIYSMDMSLNPEQYESSKNLTPEDYMDLALCKAQTLGLDKELKEYRELNKKK